MAGPRRFQSAMIVAAALLVGVTVGFVRGEPARTRSSLPASAPQATTTGTSATTILAASTVSPATTPEPAHHVLGTLAWGSGPGRIGLPEEDEAHAENPLRLAAGSDGVVLLDDENHRLVRMGHDGKPGIDVRLATKGRMRDVAVAKDGSLVVLEGEGADTRVTMFTSGGAARGALPIDPGVAARSRSVVVSGKDVYVESMRGEITRVGDLTGVADPSAPGAPGQPMRDGRGWLTARITNARKGTLHVYVVERGSEEQRFSREIRPGVFVEGVPLVDSDASGTIYVVVTGRRDETERAVLLCIEPEHGDVVGSVDLPVRLGAEAILDGKALDSGGVVYSVFTKDGLRVERHACP